MKKQPIKQRLLEQVGQFSVHTWKEGVTNFRAEVGAYEEEGALIGLNLRHCDLSVFPETILDLKNLQYLDISGNKIPEITSGIGQLRKLTELYIHDIQFKSSRIV